MSAIRVVTGRALPLRGDDVDTDRILPARFLKAVTFEGLGEHAFEDDRRALAGTHPFDRPEHAGASILLVNRNFGCGSSREHAPQALVRRGIRTVVGEGFSEIFFGNAVALGLPCVALPRVDVLRLQDLAEREPGTVFTVDLVARRVSSGGETLPIGIPDAAREALVTGLWDGLSLLLSLFDEVRAAEARLPRPPAVPLSSGHGKT